MNALATIWSARSLKGGLLLWLVPGLLLVMGGSLLWSTHFLRTQVDKAHDRALIGALRAISYNTSTASGGLAVEQPYLLLEFFELTVNGTVYFRVATEDGIAEIGNPGLPMPQQALVPDVPQLYNAQYMDEPVRVATVLRKANPPIAGHQQRHIIVQVAEALYVRERFEAAMLNRSVERDVFLIAISILLLIAGVVMTLRPLLRLRKQLEARTPDNLASIDVNGLPEEVKPLVQSINQLMARHADMARSHRQFLDDASHQLRTPLAVLRTQISYALREQDPVEIHTVLLAMQDGLTRAERLTQQMLTLARTDGTNASRTASANVSDQEMLVPVDLLELTHNVITTLWPLARARNIDLGIDTSLLPNDSQLPSIQGIDWLLLEALGNLVDNAIRYSPPHGQVTLVVYQHENGYGIMVEDNGCGMDTDDLASVGQRFLRGSAGKNQPGAGLGIAIVKTIAELHSASLHFQNRVETCTENIIGLQVRLQFFKKHFQKS